MSQLLFASHPLNYKFDANGNRITNLEVYDAQDRLTETPTATYTYDVLGNLDTDDSGLEVDHPYVAHFFSEFRDGQYVRNDQPWPG